MNASLFCGSVRQLCLNDATRSGVNGGGAEEEEEKDKEE